MPIGLGAIVSAGASILSGAAQSRAQRAQGKLQLEEAKYNKQVYDNRAKSIEMASGAEQRRIGKAQRKAQAEQKVAFGKTGAQISSGTPLVVQLDELSNMVYDLNNFKRNEAIKASEQTQAGEMTLYKGKVANQQARAQARATMISSVMTGIGQLASGYTPGETPSFDKTKTYNSAFLKSIKPAKPKPFDLGPMGKDAPSSFSPFNESAIDPLAKYNF